jgi:predicted MFS family arabinose efflux permease
VSARPFAANVPRFLAYRAGISIAFWLPIWVIYYQQRGLSLIEIGLLESATWIVSALAEIPTGALADHVGRRPCLALGALLMGLAVFAVTLPGPALSPVFVIGAILWPTAFTFINGAEHALLYDSLVAADRESSYRRVLGQATAVQQATQGVTSLIGAWFATFDISLCFTLTGIAGVLAAGLALTLQEPPRQLDAQRIGYWKTLQRGLAITIEQPLVRYQVLFGAVTLLFPFLITFVFFQPYATEVGLPIWMLGPLALVMRGGAMAGSMLAHRVSEWLGPPTVIVAAPLIIVAGLALLGLVPAQQTVVVFVGIAFASALLRPPLSELLNRSVPASERATVLSLESVVMTSLNAVVEPGIFALAALASLSLALGVSSVGLLAAGAVLLVLWWRSTVAQ